MLSGTISESVARRKYFGAQFLDPDCATLLAWWVLPNDVMAAAAERYLLHEVFKPSHCHPTGFGTEMRISVSNHIDMIIASIAGCQSLDLLPMLSVMYPDMAPGPPEQLNFDGSNFIV
jgi:hypothetical protein